MFAASEEISGLINGQSRGLASEDDNLISVRSARIGGSVGRKRLATTLTSVRTHLAFADGTRSPRQKCTPRSYPELCAC